MCVCVCDSACVCEERRKVSVALEGCCFITPPRAVRVGWLTFSGG